jgi:hypothetical protein
MIPRPIAIGLTLCDQVIVEEGTRKVSFIGSFYRLQSPAFPFVAERFCVVAILTGSQGEGEVSLSVTNLQTEEEVSRATGRITFTSRFTEVRVVLRPSECSFPSPGIYMFTLTVDDEWIAHRRILIQEMESE